ncbi:hypothetical protein CEXT_114361 [Caerostris extrusa]|uniref:Uncharacterized protein n=1 Tax=Caerostris extrusa TaxID=172846 RepID=A0AAV4YBI9_CAEEX|nr:hypothetical protein CEXT_114361 [Caerostris extrusa]
MKKRRISNTEFHFVQLLNKLLNNSFSFFFFSLSFSFGGLSGRASLKERRLSDRRCKNDNIKKPDSLSLFRREGREPSPDESLDIRSIKSVN